MSNIDFIKNTYEIISNSFKSLKEKTDEYKKPLGLFSKDEEIYACIDKCIPLITQAYNEKMPTIDSFIKNVSIALWDSTIKEYALKLKKDLKKAEDGLNDIIRYWNEKHKIIATNYKNQLQNRIDNLRC